jgi:hypothetical protein
MRAVLRNEAVSMRLILALATVAVLASCTSDFNRTAAPAPATPSQSGEPMERVVIVGSAETPDPVLARVRELEKDGVVKDVVVMESFPVQIRLTATRKVIDELNKIPRVGGLR